MELRWMTASPDEVDAEMAIVRKEGRPPWLPTPRIVLFHVNNCLLLWYLAFAAMTIDIDLERTQNGRLGPETVPALAVNGAIVLAWLVGTVFLLRWAAGTPSPKTRLQQWRRELTGRANGFPMRASERLAFTSMITTSALGVRAFPRFAQTGTRRPLEFGTLRARGRKTTPWQYITAPLPAPLPHLVLDATTNDRLYSDLPAALDRAERLSLEGDFDLWFRLYSPAAYRRDALYVLTPDVMAALVDHASSYNVEIIDDRIVFFTSPGADFLAREDWIRVAAVIENVLPRVEARARSYRDERVVGQGGARTITALRTAESDEPGPEPVVGESGRRLNVRARDAGLGTVIGGVVWFVLRSALYVIPGLIAFAGIMSIFDGR